MIDIKRYEGIKEFDKALKVLSVIPTNTEIVEKTGVSKSSVSRIMNGLSPPSKNFVDKFKKGFGIQDDENEIKLTTETANKPNYESAKLPSSTQNLDYLIQNNNDLRDTIMILKNNLNEKNDIIDYLRTELNNYRQSPLQEQQKDNIS